MNTVWSSYIQSIHTLYDTRRLRFSDRYWPSISRSSGWKGAPAYWRSAAAPARWLNR